MNPINYMQRTRDFYRAQGFQKDYVWAHNDEIPFTGLAKPLSECTVAIVTTAVVESDIPKPVRKATSYPLTALPTQLDTNEVAWDKVTTHTDDRQSYFPLEALEELANSGKIKKLAPRFHFIPTEYSQSNTLELDAPAILAACKEDNVDIALLVPL
jgi:D-proline reductase (dithiol) PrdB